MTTEQEIHQNLIRNNYDKDNDINSGLAWIALAHVSGYKDLHIELVEKQAKRHGRQKHLIETGEAIELWGSLTCKKATFAHFREMKLRAIRAEKFEFKPKEYKANGKQNKSLYQELAIYRLAKATI